MVKRKIVENNRGFRGVWIPKEIWLDDNLTVQEMVFLIEIDSLDQANGCFASNGHFSDFFGLSKSRSSEVIKKLEEKGYINIEYIREGKEIKKRIIHVMNKYIGIRETEEGCSGKAQGSNISFSNTNNYNIKAKPLTVVSLYDLKTLKTRYTKSLTLLLSVYAETYEDYLGKKHPPIKLEQLDSLADKMNSFGLDLSLDTQRFSSLIESYFKQGNIGDGNINRFLAGNANEGTIRGLIGEEY